METKEYFEKIMQDYNQNRNGRSGYRRGEATGKGSVAGGLPSPGIP